MLIRNDCKELVKAIRKKENIHSHDYVITINFCELPPEFRLATYKRGARVSEFIVEGEIPVIGQDAYKTPHTILACRVPVQWLLDGYEPTDDGWIIPGTNEWRSDAWKQ